MMSRQQAAGKMSSICAFSPCIILLFFLALAAVPATAQQFGPSIGWSIQITGMVQVEPGPNVVTLGVKKDKIRFLINDVYSRDRNFYPGQFFAEMRNRTPNVEVRGPEELLEMLIKERPSKRVLKLMGVYYLDSHTLLLHAITPLRDTPKEQF
jgi:hypothetical protein